MTTSQPSTGIDTAGRVALVTGATGGMGTAVCAELSDAGWVVAHSDLPGTQVEFEADLRRPESAAEIIGSVILAYGRIDLLVNNAATMYYGALSLDDLPRWWDTIDVNLSAPFRLARAAADELRKNEGQIINLASTLSVTGEAGFSAYCASKTGLLGLTKALARELAPKVRVNAVAPGDTDTPQQAVDAQKAGLTRAELYQRHAQTTPIGRILQPAEVARLIRYLAQETGYTGSCIHLNGGKVMI
jgi:NAD(P)-dependent dehydrogenase (short-subunit alcohol dehydrogenase family)